MRAPTWHGGRDTRVEVVDDPMIIDPTEAIIGVTSSGLCGSEPHLYEVIAPFMMPGSPSADVRGGQE
jgi:threonine dehydrogenase-like Zn-dependent dehydrogenase